MSRVRKFLVTWLLRHSRLPEVPVPVVDGATERAYREFTEAHLDGGAGPAVLTLEPPGPLLGYLQWLATRRDVVFHGTRQGGLEELRTQRETRDASAFGDQVAVFASDDPVWAMFFSVLRRGGDFRGTRNGAMSTADEPLRRRYFMSVNAEVAPGDEKTDGWLYVLPKDGFESEPPLYGHVHTSHWVSRRPVRALGRFAVAASDFPVPIVRHARGESQLRTVWRARLPRPRGT
jgi:hypothetical protein